MTIQDLLLMSAANLWRMKLRTFLTMGGVVIAIGAFVSMVSFGAGVQENVSEEYEKMGLFTTMQVYPADKDSLTDTTKVVPPLNDSIVARLGELPGVRLAYPYDAFELTIELDTQKFTSDGQVLPQAAIGTRMFSNLVAGRQPHPDSAREAMVTDEFLHDHKLGKADSIIGRTMVVSVSSPMLDSAAVHMVREGSDRLDFWRDSVEIDSLFEWGYLRGALMGELNVAARNFFEGYLRHPQITRDTLTIVGVMERPESYRLRVKPVIIPDATARRFAAAKGGPRPEDLLAAFQGGRIDNLFGDGTATGGGSYDRVTLDLEAGVSYAALSDSIKALGYESFSYLAQFEEIQRSFYYLQMILGVVGLIALATASLGIVNTLVMSILERRREIGILKSLGADDRHIWLQFIAESGVIGAIGAVAGILLGWVVTRIASYIAMRFMEREGVTPIDLFALPWYLILIALAFGTLVSVAAGLYPAARAARVDPVEALRNE